MMCEPAVKSMTSNVEKIFSMLTCFHDTMKRQSNPYPYPYELLGFNAVLFSFGTAIHGYTLDFACSTTL